MCCPFMSFNQISTIPIQFQMGNRYEFEEEGYWEDYLYINEEVSLSPPQPDGSTRPRSESTPQRSTTKREYPAAPPEMTRYTISTVEQPANVNGRYVSSLRILRPTTNLSEYKMREDNGFQRFTTREGTDIFLPKEVLQKIDFEKIQRRKGREQTINLPGRYQAKVKVRADGTILFHHYRKRGISKERNMLIETDQRGGECST